MGGWATLDDLVLGTRGLRNACAGLACRGLCRIAFAAHGRRSRDRPRTRWAWLLQVASWEWVRVKWRAVFARFLFATARLESGIGRRGMASWAGADEAGAW